MGSTGRVLVVAGEASSDAHGAGLVRALHARGFRGEFYGVGGPALQEVGMGLMAHYDDLAVIGLIEAFGAIPTALKLLRRIRREFAQAPPDLFIPIDSPELNLRIARTARKYAVPIAYFIAPQLWAWRPGRVRTILETVAELLVLFPFEEAWFRARGVPVTYVGHPMVAAAEAHPPGAARDERLILLLPGSRAGEIERHLPAMAGGVRMLRARHPELRAVVRIAPRVARDLYQPWVARADLELSEEPLFDLAARAKVAVAASGTASFEVALMGLPTIVVYRLTRISWLLAKRLVKVPWVSMANLAAGRAILPELLQEACTPENVALEIDRFLSDPRACRRVADELAAMRAGFGGGDAYDRAAEAVLGHLPAGLRP